MSSASLCVNDIVLNIISCLGCTVKFNVFCLDYEHLLKIDKINFYANKLESAKGNLKLDEFFIATASVIVCIEIFRSLWNTMDILLKSFQSLSQFITRYKNPLPNRYHAISRN